MQRRNVAIGIEFTYRVEKVGQEYKHRFDAGIEMTKNPLNTLVSRVMPLHHDNVVSLYHTFFLTFLFYVYVMERRNVHVMQRRNISIGTIYSISESFFSSESRLYCC